MAGLPISDGREAKRQIALRVEENKKRGIVMYQEGEIAGHFEENQR